MATEPVNRIKAVLAERQKTNQGLADQMGKSRVTISRWAQNPNQPGLDQLVEIANILDVDARELIIKTKD